MKTGYTKIQIPKSCLHMCDQCMKKKSESTRFCGESTCPNIDLKYKEWTQFLVRCIYGTVNRLLVFKTVGAPSWAISPPKDPGNHNMTKEWTGKSAHGVVTPLQCSVIKRSHATIGWKSELYCKVLQRFEESGCSIHPWY